jgi:predicted MFS family arabinose efflux permease
MRVIGPAIGGVLIGAVHTQGTFAAQAIFLCIAVVLTSRLRASPADRAGANEGILSSIGSGLKYVVRDRRMGMIVTMAILPSVLVYPYVTFLPVFATDVLHKDQTAYGYLAAAVGLGSLLGGGIVAATSNRERLGPWMMWACLFYCSAVAVFSLTRNLWLAVGVLAVAGIFHSIYSAFNASLMQMKAEPEYRSRVVSLQTMTWGLTPFAGLLMGRMIDSWGAPHVVGGWMVVAAVLTLGIIAGSRELRRV